MHVHDELHSELLQCHPAGVPIQVAHSCIIRRMPYVLYTYGASVQKAYICHLDSRVMFRGFASQRTYT